MSSVSRCPIGFDGTYQYDAAILTVFWPESEYHTLLARWPHLADHMETTWDEYRKRIERACAFAERAGLGVQLFPADIPSFEAFIADRGVSAPGEDDLNTYPDPRDLTTAVMAWPPARGDACWCGSGRKYKQCCRPHGLGTVD